MPTEFPTLSIPRPPWGKSVGIVQSYRQLRHWQLRYWQLRSTVTIPLNKVKTE